MGKGLVTLANGGGLYQVTSIYKKQAYADALNALYSKSNDLIDSINAAEDENKKSILKLQLLSVEKRISYLEGNMPEDEQLSIYCADLTDNLSGDVGLIEVPGESISFNIQPGYAGGALYNAARDGQLVPTIIQTPAQVFYNLAMLPGWQKWMPTFRYGTISSISGDTCDINLENSVSSQQDLNVNQSTTLSTVPIEYMDCNGTAFSIGDNVLIEFTGQDWQQPKVIGFKSKPKSCGGGFIILVSSVSELEAFAWDIATDSLLVSVGTKEEVQAELSSMGFKTNSQMLPTGTVQTVETIADPSVSPYQWIWQPPLEIPEAFEVNAFYPIVYLNEAFRPYPYIEDFDYEVSTNGRELVITTNYPYITNPDDITDLKAPYIIQHYYVQTPYWQEVVYSHHTFEPEISEQTLNTSLNYPEIQFLNEVDDFSWNTNYPDPDYKAFLSSGIATTPDGSATFEHIGHCNGWDFDEETGFTGNYNSDLQIFVKQKAPLSGSALECYDLINEYRVSQGLTPLVANLNLIAAAERHAQDLADNLLTGHIGSDGSTIATRITDAGYYLEISVITKTVVAENVAYNYTPAEAVAAWLASPPHKANIDYDLFDETGFGVALRSDGLITWVQTFGYRQGTWPGFSPLKGDLKTYLDTNINFTGAGDETNVPLFYLV